MTGWLVAVEGPSASGKSRTVREAARRFPAVVLPEAYARIHPHPALTWTRDRQLLRLELRLLREDARRFREGRRLASSGATVLADTGFLGPLTYTAGLVRDGAAPRSVLDGLLRAARSLLRRGDWGLPDAIVYLRTPAGERRTRARGDARSHPAGLQARHQRVGEYERRFYRGVIAPEFGPAFRSVSGSGTPEEVVRRVRRALPLTHAPARPPRPDQILGRIEGDRTVSSRLP